jgi:hypothetical protein
LHKLFFFCEIWKYRSTSCCFWLCNLRATPPSFHQSNVYQHTLHGQEAAPADQSGELHMAQQNQPNPPQQGNKPGQPNPMPNKPGQGTQQSGSGQQDQSANKK